jgi:hypothetical protein
LFVARSNPLEPGLPREVDHVLHVVNERLDASQPQTQDSVLLASMATPVRFSDNPLCSRFEANVEGA